jgi:hypothetical protein
VSFRGFSGPRFLIVDGAAMVHDDPDFTAVLPMPAVSRGRLIGWGALVGLRGWFQRPGRAAGPEKERVKVRGVNVRRSTRVSRESHQGFAADARCSRT